MASRRRRISHALAPALALVLAANSLALGAAHAGDIRIAPTQVEIASNRAHAEISLYNPRDLPWRARIRLFRWQQDQGRDRLYPTGDLLPSPTLLDIPAHGRQLLRLVRTGPPPAATEAAYRLVVEESAAEEIDDTRPAARMRYSLPVFMLPPTMPGQPLPLAHLSASTQGRWLTIRNTGTRHARIAHLGVTDPRGRRQAIVDGLAGYVLAGQQRRWPLSSPPGQGTPSPPTVLARVDDQAEAALPRHD